MTTDRITRPEARVLAELEFVRFAELVASLTREDWQTPTDCTGWDVRTMVLHVLGSADAQASFPQFLHQLRRGMPLNKEIDSHHWVDGMNELQIRERDQLTNDEIVAQLRAERAAGGCRRRTSRHRARASSRSTRTATAGASRRLAPARATTRRRSRSLERGSTPTRRSTPPSPVSAA